MKEWPARIAVRRAVDGSVQLLYKTDLSAEEFISTQAWRDAKLSCCPIHPDGGCRFARHGSYGRKTPSGPDRPRSLQSAVCSKGKIERYFRTCRQQFLAPLEAQGIPDLDTLNRRFRSWLEAEYHHRPHRGLDGEIPLDRRARTAGQIRY